jgi:hypothetical protein
MDKVVGKTPDKAKQFIKDVANALNAEAEKYDKETNHGDTQGATLNLDIK